MNSRLTSALDTVPVTVGAAVPPWQPGFLDIHHINTGRGNSTLALMPDGTSLLIDAGAVKTEGPAMNLPRPDATRRPGEWIARYIERRLKATGNSELGYALLTHLHGDHVGDVSPHSPASASGNYRLTGISDVAESVKIRKLIDRGYPDYNFPARTTDATAMNYIEFAKSAAARGVSVERANPGSSSQIVPTHNPGKFPGFGVRILACNGEVWTGSGEASAAHFPSQTGLAANELVSENSCSIALRLNYGRFSYFTGGDLNSDTNYGRDPWRDVETAAARVAGPVSVATCNHHGYFDSTGPEMVRALRPRAWVLQSWHASHPAMSVLANLYSPILYPGPRDVFCLGMHPAAQLAEARFSDAFKSSQGHVLVRVMPSGAEFSILVIEDGDESDHVKAIFEPYPA